LNLLFHCLKNSFNILVFCICISFLLIFLLPSILQFCLFAYKSCNATYGLPCDAIHKFCHSISSYLMLVNLPTILPNAFMSSILKLSHLIPLSACYFKSTGCSTEVLIHLRSLTLASLKPFLGIMSVNNLPRDVSYGGIKPSKGLSMYL